jgi:hypothetical protein
LSIQLVGDSRTNHLEDRGNDTIQERSNSDFDVKRATIQFYGNSHNSQSDCWIELKFYVKCLDMLCYLGLTLQLNRSSVRHRNIGQQRCTNFVIYFLLTCGLPICLGFFSKKDMAYCFGNLLAPQGSSMGCNIVSKSSRIQKCFKILFLQRFLI